jgi:hypothetical protein
MRAVKNKLMATDLEAYVFERKIAYGSIQALMNQASFLLQCQ